MVDTSSVNCLLNAFLLSDFFIHISKYFLPFWRHSSACLSSSFPTLNSSSFSSVCLCFLPFSLSLSLFLLALSPLARLFANPICKRFLRDSVILLDCLVCTFLVDVLFLRHGFFVFHAFPLSNLWPILVAGWAARRNSLIDKKFNHKLSKSFHFWRFFLLKKFFYQFFAGN